MNMYGQLVNICGKDEEIETMWARLADSVEFVSVCDIEVISFITFYDIYSTSIS